MIRRQIIWIVGALLFVLLLSGCGAGDPSASDSSAAGEASSIPEASESMEAMEEAENPSGLPDEKTLAAVDTFIGQCLDKLDQGGFTVIETEGERFPCGQNLMFAVLEHAGAGREFIRSVPETCAFIPEPLGTEGLCWDPAACDTLFVLYPETDDSSDVTYDNGTVGYSTATMLAVINPKEGTVWGPEVACVNFPEHRVTGAAAGYDTTAAFDYQMGLEHIFRYMDIPLPTYITSPANAIDRFTFTCERYVFNEGYEEVRAMWEESGLPLREFCETEMGTSPEEFCRPTQWQDLDGMVLEREDGSTLTIHASDPGEYVTATYSGAEGVIEGNLFMFGDTMVEFGIVHDCFPQN